MNKRSQGGQSLVEILVGIGIISIMVGASTVALVSVLRSSNVAEQNQSAGLIGNSLLESASVLAEGNWNSVYNLSKTSSNHYYLARSNTTTPTPVAGNESVLEQEITYGLVGHWKFDETSGTSAYDSSGSGNLGTLTNSPTRTASAGCRVGPCLSFNGTDNYVVSLDTNNILDVDYITISGWMYKSSNAADHHTVLSRNSNSFIVNFYGSLFEIYFYTSGGTCYNSGISYAQYLNGWHHFAVSYDGAESKLYIDGTLVKTQTGCSGTINSSANGVYIGSRGPASGFLEAKLDDVRVYNRALSAAEITQLYNSPVYSRYFYVDNVNRKACGSGDITTNAATTCEGSANDIVEDPATQKITVGTTWNLKGVNETLENSIYVTRWVNSISEQTDWGGNSGVSTAVSEFGSNYFESTDILFTTSGSIKL